MAMAFRGSVGATGRRSALVATGDYLGGERCSPSLRDAFGACSPFLWNRVAHMGLCRDRRTPYPRVSRGETEQPPRGWPEG